MEPHLPLSVLIQPHPFPMPKQQLSREWGLSSPYFPSEFDYKWFSSPNIVLFVFQCGWACKIKDLIPFIFSHNFLVPLLWFVHVDMIHSFPILSLHINQCMENTTIDPIHSSVEGHLRVFHCFAPTNNRSFICLLAHFICTGSILWLSPHSQWGSESLSYLPKSRGQNAWPGLYCQPVSILSSFRSASFPDWSNFPLIDYNKSKRFLLDHYLLEGLCKL